MKALITQDGAEPGRGRVRDISVSGGLYIETRAPLPVRSLTRVDLALPDGRALTFAGNVARSDAEGMAILLEGDPIAASFLEPYVEAAHAAHSTGSLEIQVELVIERSEEIALSRAFYEVAQAPSDAVVHQRFIEACLGVKRLDYALPRLRALKVRHPKARAIDKSLAQIGGIIGFVALRSGSTRRQAGAKRALPGLLAFFLIVLGLLGLVAMVKVATHEYEAHTNGR